MKAEGVTGERPHQLLSDNCFETPSPPPLVSTAQRSALLCSQQPGVFHVLCALCPGCRGGRQISPPTQSWKSFADFSNTKATMPQTTTGLLVDGESLICPSGGFL